MTGHLWQPYPFADVANLFQCSACRVLASDAASVEALPAACPGQSPRLPHVIRMRPVPGGSKRLACLCCTLPAKPGAFEWQCGNGFTARQELSATR